MTFRVTASNSSTAIIRKIRYMAAMPTFSEIASIHLT